MKEYESNTDNNNYVTSMTSPRLLQVVSAADGYSTLICLLLLFNLQVLKAGLK